MESKIPNYNYEGPGFIHAEHYESIPKGESIVEDAIREYCEKRGYTYEISPGYSTSIYIIDGNNDVICQEIFGE